MERSSRDGGRAALVALLLGNASLACGKTNSPATAAVLPPKSSTDLVVEALAASVETTEAPASPSTLPRLSHVKALVRGSSARISFDPFPGAVDYRVYAAPRGADVHRDPDGSQGWIERATYRCAGLRAVAPVRVDRNDGPPSNPYPNWLAVITQVDDIPVEGFTRGLKDATLGYAFREPGGDTVPIYAVGDPAAKADNYGNGMRERETRAKLYVRDSTSYLAKGWRDDGVAFYAPASTKSTACEGKTPIAISTQTYPDKNGALDFLYYAPGPEAAARGASRGPGAPAFLLCPNHAGASEPVMRVHYMLLSPGGNFGGQGGHDELALGRERFDRARCQGATSGACATVSQALWQVHWSNITKPMELVVEALDAGCPFQGLMGSSSLPPTLNALDSGSPATEEVFTFDQLRTAAAHGEVFLNGQFDRSPAPHPVARSVVQVAPTPRPAMDFESHFESAPETLTETFASGNVADCGYTPRIRDLTRSGDPQCDGSHHLQSATYDALAFDQVAPVYSLGVVQGEMWSAFSTGELRFSPRKAAAAMSDSKYLHVAMEASSFTTDRRYPQIVISQQDFMTGEWLLKRSSITPNPAVQPFVLVQPFDAGPGKMVVEVELCSQRGWAVNDHCPWFLLEKLDPPARGQVGPNNPHPDAHDHLQHDDSARFDVYLSTKRAYVFFEDEPYGCADIENHTASDPSGGAIAPAPAAPPAGPVTVAFGDVHYHPAAESGELGLAGPFGIAHMFIDSVRHFDYVGWKSGVAAPAWDESRFPCIRQMHQGGNAGPQQPEND